MIIIMINKVVLGSTFNVKQSNFTDLTQKCSPCKNSRQITANAKIHGFHEFVIFV